MKIAFALVMLSVAIQGCSARQALPPAPEVAPPKKAAPLRPGADRPRKPGEPEVLYPKVEIPAEVPEVLEAIRYYQGPGRKFVLDSWLRRAPLLSTLHVILRQHGLPLELTNVALIESGFKKEALSQSGTGGIWQFTKRTAEFYGLRVDEAVDERIDIAASTGAAARYFQDLYEIYGDWKLSVAAFNCGDSRLSKLVRDSGAKDFFELSRMGLLPPVTRQFVPRFIALSLIDQDPKRFGFPDPALLAQKGKKSKKVKGK